MKVKVEIKVPSVGESVQEATIAQWLKKSGEAVKRDEVLLLLETDKASVEVVAETAGVLNIQSPAGSVVKIGAVVGAIDSDGKASVSASPAATPTTPTPSATASTAPSAPTKAPTPAAFAGRSAEDFSPAVRKMAADMGVDPGQMSGTGRGGRVTKEDLLKGTGAPTGNAPSVLSMIGSEATKPTTTKEAPVRHGETRRVPMTTIRKRIAERLVEAQRTAAILTTFNEIDMSALMSLRSKYKENFNKKYGVNLGFMGFFVKACVEALKEFPDVNASIEGTDVLYHDFYHVGVAVGTERGLIVPVIRDADLLSLAEIEMTIRDFAVRARDGKITVADLSGGTFTISNGGVYGSLMSTPILNPPQSGILGMHKIEERPVAINGKVEIRPMMYIALSYDHRLIDGKGAVSFLVRVKEFIEDPQRLVMGV